MGRSSKSLYNSISIIIPRNKEFFLFQKHSTNKLISLLIIVLLVSSPVLFSNNASAAIETVSVGFGPIASCLNTITDTVYISNFYNNTISVIDGTPGSPTENTVIDTIINIPTPSHCVVNESTNELYVNNEFAGLITIINGSTNTVIDVIDVLAVVGPAPGPFPIALSGIDFNPVTNLLYSTDLAVGRLFVIDMDPNNSTGTFRTIIDTLPTGIFPFAVLVNPDTNIIYVANNGFPSVPGSPSVSVINGTTTDTIKIIPVTEVGTPGKGPFALTLNPVDKLLYVAICDTGRFPGIIAVIDVDLTNSTGTVNTIIDSIPVESPGSPSFDPVNNLLFVPNQGGNTITVIDTTSNTRIATIPGGDFPIFTTIDIDNRKLYAPNFRTELPPFPENFPEEAGTVTILDLTDLPPAANAGPDQSVLEGVEVTLDGSGSLDLAGDSLTFSWIQIVGPTIPLSFNTTVNPTFTAPQVDFPIALTYQLTVNDGTFDVQDIVNIFIIDSTTFDVSLTGADGEFAGNVTVGSVTEGTLIQLEFPTSGFVDGELQQMLITTNASGSVEFTFDISQDAPVGDTSLIFSDTALFFDIGFTGIDFSNPENFLSANTKILIDKGFTAGQQFSDACPVMSFSFFNEGTSTWEILGDPLKPNANKIYVTNSESGTVSVIDAATNTVVATIPVGTVPFDIALNPDTNLVYVVNRDSDSISVIDGDTNTVVATIPVGDSPIAIAINPNTNTLYLLNEFLDKISVINGSTNTVVSTIDVGTGPVELGVNLSTNTIYVANQDSDTVSVINGSTNTVVDTIPLGAGAAPSAIAVNPNINRIYVANSGFDTVSVIDGATNTKVADTPVGDIPISVVVNPKTNRVFVYVANVFSNSVSVIDGTLGSPTENLLLASITVGSAPSDIDINPNIDKIFVTNNLDNSVSVIDGFTNTEVAVINVGSSPIGLVVDSDVLNPIRDPSSDVLDISTGEILQCAYFAEMEHFSKFAIGGVKFLALASLASSLGGGGTDGFAPVISLGTLITNKNFEVPDEIEKIVKNHDSTIPLESISTSIFANFDLPLTINENGYPLAGYSNTIETFSADIGEPITITSLYYEQTTLQHVSMYLNLRGIIKGDLSQSDTQILYNKDKPLDVIDPNGFFEKVSVNVIEDEDKSIKKFAQFEIIFAKPMERSDIVLRSWDDKRRSMDIIIYDAIEVIDPENITILDDTLESESIEELIPPDTVVQKVPEWMKNISEWWSQGEVDDTKFKEVIQFLIQEEIIDVPTGPNVSVSKDDELAQEELQLDPEPLPIPEWVKNNAEWWSQGVITEDDFLKAIEYLVKNGIIQI